MPDEVATWSATFSLLDLLLARVKADIQAIKAEIGLLDIPEDVSPEVGTLKTDVAVLKTGVAALQTSVGNLQTRIGTTENNVTYLLSRIGPAETNIATLQTNVGNVQSNVGILQTIAGNLETDVNALKTAPEPITFVFGGVPAVNSMINVPLTRNLSITSANLATNSRYYNAVNPSSGTTTFQLRRMPANTLIGAFNVTAGTGAVTWTYTISSVALSAGDTLRMTAAAVGPDVTDVAITIHATRR